MTFKDSYRRSGNRATTASGGGRGAAPMVIGGGGLGTLLLIGLFLLLGGGGGGGGGQIPLPLAEPNQVTDGGATTSTTATPQVQRTSTPIAAWRRRPCPSTTCGRTSFPPKPASSTPSRA